MNSRWRILSAFAVAILIFVSAPTASAASYSQKKLRTGQFPVRTVCMMPPQGHLTRFGLKGAEVMTSESDVWAEVLGAFVESHLKSDGISFTPASSLLDSGASQDELQQVLIDIEEKYNAVSQQLDKKPGQVGKSGYTLGDQVASLPCSAKSDLLVFVQGTGQVLTGGRAAMTFLVGGPADVAILLVTMVDAKTGEILAFIRLRASCNVDDTEGTFGKFLDDELAGMNIGSSRKNNRAGTH